MPHDPLKPFPWFSFVGSSHRKESLVSALGKVSAGLLIGGFLGYQGFVAAGIMVCTIALAVGVVSAVSPRCRLAISTFFGILGKWFGRVLGMILLAPLYLVVFSFARFWQRLFGSDPLQLRDTSPRTFWLETDDSRRKRRYVGTMFATERLANMKLRLLPTAIVLVVVVLAGELTLRGMGFGDPILYINDPLIGYYPAPSQDVTRSGGRISTNQFGMRSPECSLQKPAGTFRVLMIGDSTLYGGSYIDQEELYSRLFEKRLAETAAYEKVEVLSIGVNAWGPFHKLGYVKQKGTFDADLAVICMPIGDIYRPLYGLTAVPFFSVDHPPRCAIEEVLGHLAWRYRATVTANTSHGSQEEQGQLGIQAYVELAQLLRQNGCTVVFEILPSREAGTGKDTLPAQQQATDQLRQALAVEGFDDFSYPVGLFAGKGSPEEIYHDRCHLYHQGHRIYAEYLTQQIGPQIARHSVNGKRPVESEARRREVKSGHSRR
jgi:hypothetical protein